MSHESESLETGIGGLWQINVLYNVGNISTILLTVTKNCYTAELFEKLRQHPKAPRADDFQLYSVSGTIRRCLVDNKEERLSDYGITDRSTFVIVVRLLGGVWPTMVEVEAEPRHLKPADGITLTTISDEHPDVFHIVYDGPGVIMRCGHATAPMPLARYCLSELEKGKDEIRCPVCNNKWKFALLKPAACLTQNEITEFEQRAHLNYFGNNQSEMNPCPKCGTFSRPYSTEDKRVVCQICTSRSGKTFEFCWTCLGEWKTCGNETCGNPNCGSKKGLIDILKNCETKELNDVEVPSKRACPNCAMIIHHVDGCKHMTCRHCSYQFCFICLRKYPCVSGDFEPCDVAPRQTDETNFTNVSIDPEKQLHSDESSEESEEDSIGEPSTICLARQEDDIAAVLDYLNYISSNAVSSDDITVGTNNDRSISSRMGNVTVSTNNYGVSTTTIGFMDATVHAGNTAVDNTSTGNDKLDTKNVLSSAETYPSNPSNTSGFRRFCVIQ